ncbi:MAG TPA: UDP-N-acetylmuramoyl-tripeptide--D-alanyl-D-alanine ligase [Longimicrobiales bacterium]|nr:UDP-N-acetylmuramoyl-tripeptide--D-alanyl-D-alanine ligase [Longimicrobiales bacterium]
MTGFRWTAAAVREALGLGDGAGDADAAYAGVSTDSRTLEAGDLFVALEGDAFDGHDFVDQAVAAGARGVVLRRAVDVPDQVAIYRVEDTLVALGRLARFRRLALPARVVGITGSSGKTTTKELLKAAVGTRLRVHANRGNFNNRIGVPLTLLEAPEDAEVVISEMGTSLPGEIRALVEIGVPDVAILTTVAESHLEGLGTLQGVLEEKLDLLRGLRPGAVALAGDEPPILPDAVRSARPDARIVGTGDAADPADRPEDVRPDTQGRYTFRWHGAAVTLPAPGRHILQDALLALAAAEALGVPPEDAARGLAGMESRGMRGEERHIGPVLVVLDCYNANPQSTRAALDTLVMRAAKGPRIAILGSMLELGHETDALHERVLNYALAVGLDRVVATGAFATAAPDRNDPALIRAEDPEDGFRAVQDDLEEGAVVLLKASRGVALERLLPVMERALTGEGG